MQVQELVAIVPWNFVATICNLFIQMYLIKRFLFKPINKVLEQRRAMADRELQEAREAKKSALAMQEEYEQNIARAKDQAGEIIREARRTADSQSEKLLQEAARQAASMKESAEREISREKRKAVTEAKEEIGGIAMDIAGKVSEREISQEDHQKLIEEFIANVGEAS